MNDPLRDAFDDLAAHPPLVLGRKEAVMSRITRRLQRQAAVRGAAGVLAASLLGAGAVGGGLQLASSGSDTPEPRDEVTVEATATPTPTASHEAHRERTAPEPHATASQEAPTTEPTAATTAPTHAPVAPEPHREPTAAPAATEDTSAVGPLSVQVSMADPTVDTSTDARVLVTARDEAGRLLAVDIAWGDGQTFHFSPGDAACPRTTHLDGSFVHRYAQAGSFAPQVTVTSGDCAPTEKVTRGTHVTVSAAQSEPTPTQTNGPSQPQASAAKRTGDNPSYAYLNAKGRDDDGWVRRITVAWGDGTTTTAGEWSPSGCTNASGTSHPVASAHDGNASHHFADAGDHTVTVTVTSSACDGTDVQTGSSTATVNQPQA